VDVLHLKDGRVFRRFVAPHRLGSRIVGQVATYQEITESVHSQAALSESRAFLERAQSVAHVGSWVSELDGSGRLTWSAETLRIFGAAEAEFAGTTEAFFAFVHPDDREMVHAASDAAVAAVSRDRFEVEHRIIRSDGEVRWVDEKADVVRDAFGRAIRLIGTVQDITDRRHLEEHLRQSQKLEAIGRLAGGVAHDLNNALTAIAGYTELALGALPAGHEARPDVQEIRQAAARAESVTRQLLAFSRRQQLQPRVFSLNDAVLNVERMLDRFLGPGIRLILQTSSDLPPIYGDPGQIEQAIVNLAVNARDAMPDGGQLTLALDVVEVRAADSGGDESMPAGRYVELAIIDQGQGMTPEIAAQIFEPFFTTKAVGKGTGLGLAMVYGTVRQSGGFISVESEVGHGSTFRLRFPPARRGAPVPAGAAIEPQAECPLVLIVEDDVVVRNLVVMSLANRGYRILHAGSGHEALAVIQQQTRPLDLLVTDANMPGMSGIELVSTLVPERPELRVIVMSGYTEELARLAGLAERITLLPKPFTPRELRQKVAAILSNKIG